MIIDAAIWDVQMLNRILTECRVYERNDPADAGSLVYPPEQLATLNRVIDLMWDATQEKARRRLR